MEPSLIENYVGLYIGCQVDTGKTGLATNLGLLYDCATAEGKPDVPKLQGMALFFNQIGDNEKKLAAAEFSECKLALRPLTDMTEAEAMTIAHHVYFSHYEFNDIRAERRSADKWMIYSGDITSDYKVCIVLTDNLVGIYNAETRKYDNVAFNIMSELTPWYLDNHFDIFNLIKQEAAVDITKINKP